MPRVYMPSSKGVGIDGLSKKYTSRRGQEGYVDVDDRDAEYIRQVTGLQVGERFTALAAPGKVCSKCAFEQFAAMAGETCTKCGGEWLADTSSPQGNPPVQSGRRKTYDI